MYWAKVALALLSPLCQGSPDSTQHIAPTAEVVDASQVVEISSLGKASIVRSESELERAEVRLHLQADGATASLAESARSGAALNNSFSLSHMVALRTNGVNKVDLGWAPCAWQRPTADETMHCADGTYCNPKTEQWTCCATHGGRLQCPKSLPYMCMQMDCGGNDYCCADWCEYYDGDKPCSIKHKIYGIDQGWLNLQTRDDAGVPVTEWTDLVSGPMTWEMWYARRPQAPTNTADGNALMATYADNHNTDAFTTHNRRRNIGVYIQPDGQLSMSTFIGPDVPAVAPSGDPYGGASVVLGPTINDTNWHHIAVVWNKTEGKGWLSLDGVKYATGVKYEPGTENPGLEGKLVIGGGHLGRTTTAQMSQFRIWKVAMHTAQLQSMMQCGEPDLPSSDLKGFFRLSGDLDNSVTSGFTSLQWEGSQGVFAEGEPCTIGQHGLKGLDAWGGPPGVMGLAGIQGTAGDDSEEVGPPGNPGSRGPKGPPGPPPAFSILAVATMQDLYIMGAACSVITLVAVLGIYCQFIYEKAAPKSVEPAAESWEGEGAAASW